MVLIIVESPTKARTLSRFLGKDYSIEATMGHIKDLPKSELGVDVENNFEPKYLIVQKKNEAIKKIQNEGKKAKSIFIATDPDREGEAIAQHIEEILRDTKNGIRDKDILRIAFHEITKGAVEKSIQSPHAIDKHLVDAQIARRVLDRLVGYKLSPLLWKKVRRGLSAGRVQSVAVRLIVEREREIEKFIPVEFWEIFTKLKIKNEKLKINELIVKLIKISNKSADIKSKEFAEKVVGDLKKSVYRVFEVKNREVIKSPYPPFTTSTLTQSAARLFGWSAKKTMSIAQKLYEEGLITYHRTDSVNLAPIAVDKVRKFISEKYGQGYLPEKPRFFKKTSKLAQEAHEAIRPTDIVEIPENLVSGNGIDVQHEKLYQMIWKRFVACQMNACIFDETVIDVNAEVSKVSNVSQVSGEGSNSNLTLKKSNNYLLRASGQVLKFDGWRKIIPLAKDEEPELPYVEKDDALDLIEVNSLQKFTQPPPRYNEASLIKTLEKLGIGRPSTYAPIITTIQVRNYVEKNEGKFFPTPVGVAVNDFLVKNFMDELEYSFTAKMEESLDEIARGNLEWKKMMKVFFSPFEKKLEHVDKESKRVKIEAEKLGRKCPTCQNEGRVGKKQGELVIRVGRFGKFISCSLFPECKHTEKYIEKVGMKCPKCTLGDVIIKNTKSGRKFFGCSRYPTCDWASWRKPGMEKEKPVN